MQSSPEDFADQNLNVESATDVGHQKNIQLQSGNELVYAKFYFITVVVEINDGIVLFLEFRRSDGV